VPTGRIRRVEPGPHFPHDRAVFVSGEGLGERNRVAMIVDDMPFLANEEVRYIGEPIALVAASGLREARHAARHAVVEIEASAAIFTLAEAEREWRKNPTRARIFAEYRVNHGNADRAIAAAPIVVEGIYATPDAEQAYIEPQGVIAWPRKGSGILIEGSLQCPYYIHPALVRLLGCDPHEVIVRQAPTGGAFGGKEDFPSLIAGHAALLAHACARPVKLVYPRSEDILYTTKRHPSVVRHVTGLTEDGRLLAMKIEILLDGGAYTTLSPVVLARAVLTATGPYECPNVAIHGVCLATHTPPKGAFRGFGAPQVGFASEVHMDRIAERVGVTPDEIRRRNVVRVGSITATGQTLRESVGAERVLDEALRVSGFREKWNRPGQEGTRDAAESGAAAGRPAVRATESGRARKQRGLGLALIWHGAGFTGSGEKRLASRAALTVEADNRLLIRVSNVEMGQGAHTALPQIAASRLGIPLSLVSCARPDTSEVPDSGPTVASRTVMIVGSLVDDCAGQLARALARVHDDLAGENFDKALTALRATDGPLRFEAVYRVPSWMHWDEEKFIGDAYATFGYACTVAEVEVDTETFEVKVNRIVSACDVGRAINPVSVEGQIEGGVLQGVGFALFERLTLQKGQFEQDRFQTYLIPTALDAPEIIPVIVEERYSGGPGGAKGMGEMPINGPAPAIANAIAQAVGLRICDLPITPETLFTRSRAGEAESTGGSKQQ